MIKEGKYMDTAIRSLYQMILAVDGEELTCRKIDMNPEFSDYDTGTTDFRDFRNQLYINTHPEDRERIISFTDEEQMNERLSKNVYISAECRLKHSDRSYFWYEIILCNSSYEDNTEGKKYLLLVHDIHERKSYELKKEAELRMQMLDLQGRYNELFIENMTDEQTGCYNRKGMKYYSDIVLKEASVSGKYLFVCVADLNGLKHLNDTYGHAAGDEAIAAVSAQLKANAPEGSRIVRTGGDEFLILSTLEKDSSEPGTMGSRIDEGLSEYNSTHDNPYEIGVSYGWVLMPAEDGMVNLDKYIAMADEKMYEMKTGRDKYRR